MAQLSKPFRNTEFLEVNGWEMEFKGQKKIRYWKDPKSGKIHTTREALEIQRERNSR